MGPAKLRHPELPTEVNMVQKSICFFIKLSGLRYNEELALLSI